MKKLIEIVFNPIPNKRIEILEKLLSLMKSTGMKMESLDTHYGNVSAEQYLSDVEIEGDWRYQFESAEIEVIHGEIGAHGLYHLMISEKSPGVIRDPKIWGVLLLMFPDSCPLELLIAHTSIGKMRSSWVNMFLVGDSMMLTNWYPINFHIHWRRKS